MCTHTLPGPEKQLLSTWFFLTRMIPWAWYDKCPLPHVRSRSQPLSKLSQEVGGCNLYELHNPEPRLDLNQWNCKKINYIRIDIVFIHLLTINWFICFVLSQPAKFQGCHKAQINPQHQLCRQKIAASHKNIRTKNKNKTSSSRKHSARNKSIPHWSIWCRTKMI